MIKIYPYHAKEAGFHLGLSICPEGYVEVDENHKDYYVFVQTGVHLDIKIFNYRFSLDVEWGDND